jgi:hypothetical protein
MPAKVPADVPDTATLLDTADVPDTATLPAAPPKHVHFLPKYYRKHKERFRYF